MYISPVLALGCRTVPLPHSPMLQRRKSPIIDNDANFITRVPTTKRKKNGENDSLYVVVYKMSVILLTTGRPTIKSFTIEIQDSSS